MERTIGTLTEDFALVKALRNAKALENKADLVNGKVPASQLPAIGSFEIRVVDALPATGDNGVLYLLRKSGGEAPDYCEEYVWVEDESRYELLGTAQVTAQELELTFSMADGTTETHKFLVNDEA